MPKGVVHENRLGVLAANVVKWRQLPIDCPNAERYCWYKTQLSSSLWSANNGSHYNPEAVCYCHLGSSCP